MVAALVAVTLIAAPARAGEPVAQSPALAALLHDARERKLAESREWQVMLHYRPTAFGGWKSQADGLGFFFAGKVGKTDREAELAATIAALLRPSVRDPTNPETMHPQCLFPARYAWIKEQLGAAAFTDQTCPLLDTWRTGISAEAATLIYATAYLNSPASMYGHTFLRLQRATGEGNPLLDYAVNFAADADTTNGMVYAIAGLTGGFQGHFYVVPYYVKVQEYSNMESRDLWEYELALTREQIERLVLHAWETRSTYFDYFFLDENCSYQLLTLLEVADPTLHLIDDFGGRVVPADTIRVVIDQPGLVRRIGSRPSLVSTMTERRSHLDGRE
ncbi:MAG TPA: DUF4105 domain-containing protein, partial [Vicinamibacterales bacterium]|nr:DUF4105 domain-containing protein [Vicinamibacterales bacterium]